MMIAKSRTDGSNDAEARAWIRMFFQPLTLILVSIPLVLELIPRNRWYGFRMSETMSSDTVWYPANRLAGIGLIAAALIWIAAALYAPRRYVKAIGISVVLIVVAILLAYGGSV